MSDKDNDKIKNPIAVAAREKVNTKTESTEGDPGCCSAPPEGDTGPIKG
jgi:hypothetical protein